MADGDEVATAVEDAPAPQEALDEVQADSGALEHASAETTAAQRVQELEEQLAASAKKFNDLNSQVGGRRTAQERDDALHGRLDTILTQNARMLEAFALQATDPDKADKLIEDLKAESVGMAAQQKSLAEWEDIRASYLDDLTDVLDGSGLDPKGDELAATAKAWQAANAAQDKAGMERAIRLAERAVTAASKAKAKEGTPKRDARASLEMASAGSGGAAPESNEALWNSYGRGEIQMTDKVRAAAKALGYL